jgi:CBS domain-containing protein
LVKTLKNIATREIVSIEADQTVKSAARLMSKRGIGSLMVTSNGKPVGIVTERDILTRVIAEGVEPAKAQVKAVMSSPLITIKEDASLADATILMHLKKIRHLFVVDGGQVVGILTDRDLQLQVFEYFTALGQL